MDQEYSFNIGDEVIDKWGRCGKIVEICDCERCKLNGWNDIAIEYKDQSRFGVTHWDRDNGFDRYYKIGQYVFGNTDLYRVNYAINFLEKRLVQEYAARDVLLGILNKEVIQ